MNCVFEYLYRDASNYKAWGRLLLQGEALPAYEQNIRECLESGLFFIATPAGVPDLRHELFELSDGYTEDDHEFHEFVELRAATNEEQDQLERWGALDDLVRRLKSAAHLWKFD